LHVATQALRGLDYAHRARDAAGAPLGVVHRDVSPANLFVSRSGEVKIGDFGIALSALRSSKTLAGTIKGKVAYMPPEQLRGEKLDPRADVYAMGVVLYEALTLRRPFDGTDASIPDILVGSCKRAAEVDPEVTTALDAIVMEAMRPHREDRPPSAAALCERLEEYALRSGWSLSPSAFAEFVTRLADEAQPALGGPAAFAPGFAFRRVEGDGGLSVFATVAGARAPEAPTVAATPAPIAAGTPTVAATPAAVARADVPAPIPETRAGPPARSRSVAAILLALGAFVLLGGLVLAFSEGSEEASDPGPQSATPTNDGVLVAKPRPEAPAAVTPPQSAAPSISTAPRIAAQRSTAPHTTAPRTSAPRTTSAAEPTAPRGGHGRGKGHRKR